MDTYHQHNRTPFEPAFGQLVPMASLALSLPTLAVDIVVAFHALTGATFDISARSVHLPPVVFAFGCLYTVFGPFLGGILCISQRTHAEQAYGSVHLLGYRIMLLNTIALYTAVLALGLLLLSGVLTTLGGALAPARFD